jgi:hypothetical protein
MERVGGVPAPWTIANAAAPAKERLPPLKSVEWATIAAGCMPKNDLYTAYLKEVRTWCLELFAIAGGT